MSLDLFIISVYCRIDETLRRVLESLPKKRLRASGPAPALSDAEVLTIEVVGSFLGFNPDKPLFEYFQRHYSPFFPALRKIHRTPFIRQAAALWKVKEAIWRALLKDEALDVPSVIPDSMPVPVCRFARAKRCVRFAGEAAFGHDWGARQTFYGFRFHALVGPDGLVRCFYLTGANEDEKTALEDMVEGKTGRVLGDRHLGSPRLIEALKQQRIDLWAP